MFVPEPVWSLNFNAVKLSPVGSKRKVKTTEWDRLTKGTRIGRTKGHRRCGVARTTTTHTHLSRVGTTSYCHYYRFEIKVRYVSRMTRDSRSVTRSITPSRLWYCYFRDGNTSNIRPYPLQYLYSASQSITMYGKSLG